MDISSLDISSQDRRMNFRNSGIPKYGRRLPEFSSPKDLSYGELIGEEALDQSKQGSIKNADAWDFQKKVTELSDVKLELDRWKDESRQARERHEQARQDWQTENEARLADVQSLFEDRKQLLEDENVRLRSEKDGLKAELARLQSVSDRSHTLGHGAVGPGNWEAQVNEIIQWVSDEKEARAYLQALASKLSDDMEHIKDGGPAGNYSPLSVMENRMQTSGTGTGGWGSRRLHKMNKMELLDLQRSLQSEIKAKQMINDELTKTRAAYLATKTRLDESEMKISEMSKDLEKKDTQMEELQRQLGILDLTDSRAGQGSFFNMLDYSGHRGGIPSPGVSPQPGQNNSFRNSYLSMGSASTSEYELSNTARSQLLQQHSTPQLPPTYENAATVIAGTRRTPPGTAARAVSPKTIVAMNATGTLIKGGGAQNAKPHRFTHVNFATPTKCGHCTSLLVGLSRQGLICQDCNYASHVGCISKVPPQCPVPPENKRPLGIDPIKGVGTAYEGLVKSPKLGGVKKGWQNTYVVVCDFKLFLYDCQIDRSGTKPTDVNPFVTQVLDMRDECFSVGSVTDSDVIHATKSDIARIFRVMTSQFHSSASAGTSSATLTPGAVNMTDASLRKQYTLLMADTAAEKSKWVIALNELHRLLRKSKLPDKRAFLVKEVFDHAVLPMLRHATCAAIVDRDRVVVGTNDHGLVSVELDRDALVPVGGEKENKRPVERVEFVEEEHLLITVSGRERCIRLIPTSALDGRDLKWIKVDGTKQCHTFCVGPVQNKTAHFLCVAVKKTVLVFKINRSGSRHEKIREFAMPGTPQHMSIINGKLCVGYPSGFRMWDLTDNSQSALLSLEDSTLSFLNQSSHDAHLIIEVVPGKEFLLIFARLGIYVDNTGRRSRSQELMFPAVPSGGFAHLSPYLCVYSETHVDVFNVVAGEWVQTLNLKKAKPLSTDGALSICLVGELPYAVVLTDMLSDEELLNIPMSAGSRGKLGKSERVKRRKYSFRNVREDDKQGKIAENRRSALPISTPSDFVHITHMGPGEGIEFQKLIDLKNQVSPGGPGSKVKQLFMGPVMRSTSTGSSGVHGVKQTRPTSSHSKSSEGSSLGREGKNALEPMHHGDTSYDSNDHSHRLSTAVDQSSPRHSTASSGSSAQSSASPTTGGSPAIPPALPTSTPPKKRSVKSQLV